MYHVTTNNIDLNCDFCDKKIPAGSKYFDDSIYNSLYGKKEQQKSLCFECGEKYSKEMENRCQEYERLQRWPRIVNLIVMLAAFCSIFWALDYIGKVL